MNTRLALSNEMTNDEDEDNKELSNEDLDDFDLPRVKNDPWGRRRRRRRSRRRRGRWIQNLKTAIQKIREFLKKHGETIKMIIRHIRRAIYHCCDVTFNCSGQRWCKFGKQ